MVLQCALRPHILVGAFKTPCFKKLKLGPLFSGLFRDSLVKRESHDPGLVAHELLSMLINCPEPFQRCLGYSAFFREPG